MKRYKIVYQEKQEIKNKRIDESEIDFYKNSFDILSINEIKSDFTEIFKIKRRISKKDLYLLFYELNIMLESNINISDAIFLIKKSKKSRAVIEFLDSINYAFSNSSSINLALKDYKIDSFIKDFLENSQINSNLASNVKAIYLLLKEQEEIKKSFKKVLYYPFFLLFTFFISIFIIFSFVVPSFKSIFHNQMENLPTSTKILLNFEIFFLDYFFLISFLILAMIFLFISIYKINSKFQLFIDIISFKYLFIFSKILKNLEFYKLFLLIDIMQKSKYEFHKSFLDSKLLLKNKYLLDRIELIDKLLTNGKSISFAFSKSEIFDDIILNLLNTGEVSNNLEVVVSEIKKIYKSRFDNSVNLMISFISPFFLIIISSMILFLVLAIFTPIWQMGNLIK
ncbi:type II secretion system F family protein [Arcobacter porcinus]|uniref:type II secretion system F family protein n=1 Tax=Arcobacter porcinus TaxID=1935204 RepID=UPI000824CADC|nr:type II secretion system F family protein [Arcobacter porcinus]OCL86133.1 Type II secretion system protein F [Arcobacter porcinus]